MNLSILDCVIAEEMRTTRACEVAWTEPVDRRKRDTPSRWCNLGFGPLGRRNDDEMHSGLLSGPANLFPGLLQVEIWKTCGGGSAPVIPPRVLVGMAC